MDLSLNEMWETVSAADFEMRNNCNNWSSRIGNGQDIRI